MKLSIRRASARTVVLMREHKLIIDRICAKMKARQCGKRLGVFANQPLLAKQILLKNLLLGIEAVCGKDTRPDPDIEAVFAEIATQYPDVVIKA